MYGVPWASTMLRRTVPVQDGVTRLPLATLTRSFGDRSSMVSKISSRLHTLMVAPLSHVKACFLCFAVRPRAISNAIGRCFGGGVASATSVCLAGRRLRTMEESYARYEVSKLHD